MPNPVMRAFGGGLKSGQPASETYSAGCAGPALLKRHSSRPRGQRVHGYLRTQSCACRQASAAPWASMATGEGLAHSNLFVKSQLLSQQDFDEAALLKIFSPYGHIDSCRLVIKPKHSIAFVRFSSISEAEAALSLNGTQVNGFTLEVKLADADAGPPAAGATPYALPLSRRKVVPCAAQQCLAGCGASPPFMSPATPCLPAVTGMRLCIGFGQTASDNLYVRGLDTGWTEADLSRLFSTYGNVKARPHSWSWPKEADPCSRALLAACLG